MTMAYSKMKRRELKRLRKARREWVDHEGPWTSKHAKAKRQRFVARQRKKHS